MSVTQKEIARMLGFTHSTVSRSLQGDSRISSETRQAVRRLADSLRYRPNLAARGLKGCCTDSVGVIWPLTGAARTMDAVHLLSSNLQASAYLTSIVDSLSIGIIAGSAALNFYKLPEAIIRILDDFLSRGIYNAVLDWRYGQLPIPDEILRKFEAFKSVTAVTMWPHRLAVNEVVHDRTQAYRDVARHFANTGRKRPALLTAGSDVNAVNVQAFVDEAQRHGVSIAAGNIICFDFDYFGTGLSIAEKTMTLLDSRFSDGRIPFDAVFCINDETALTTMSWLRNRGIRTPEDVAVAGINNTDAGMCSLPPLASVKRNDEQVAAAVKDIILSKENISVCRTVAMEFVYRPSAG